MNQRTMFCRAGLFGAVTGLRSMLGISLLSRRLSHAPEADRGGPLSSALSSAGAANLLAVLSAGEAVVDKLPDVPARTIPGAVAERAIMGALVGAAVCSEKRGNVLAGAMIGAAASVAATYGGYYLRRWLTTTAGLPDAVVALGEDGLALALGRQAAAM